MDSLNYNPIPKNGLFNTPESLDRLVSYVDSLPKDQRANAYVVVTMALNWANKEVEKMLANESAIG
jgi:hypothetical protein